jgi:hypothetical protein
MQTWLLRGLQAGDNVRDKSWTPSSWYQHKEILILNVTTVNLLAFENSKNGINADSTANGCCRLGVPLPIDCPTPTFWHWLILNFCASVIGKSSWWESPGHQFRGKGIMTHEMFRGKIFTPRSTSLHQTALNKPSWVTIGQLVQAEHDWKKKGVSKRYGNWTFHVWGNSFRNSRLRCWQSGLGVLCIPRNYSFYPILGLFSGWILHWLNLTLMNVVMLLVH